MSEGKALGIAFGVVITLVASVATILTFAHKQDNQNLSIVQSMGGTTEVRRQAGWWIQVSPTIWTYPKAGMYTLCKKDGDSLSIQFNNKTTADLNCQIGYRIDTATDEQIIALHQQVEGKDEVIWQMVLKALNTAAQSITTKYDPSAVIGGEKFDPMVRELYAAMIHNPVLLAQGIDVNYFAVDGRPIPDDKTKAQFEKQKEAALARQLALAEKETLEAETIKTQAKYAREIAEFRGKADAETAKQVTEAERQKRLAEIAAQQKVEVEKLAKEQLLVQMMKEKEAAEIEAEKKVQLAEIQKREMLVQAAKEKEVAEIAVQREKEVAAIAAEKERVVAEIAKLTEAERLEQVKLQADQKVALAEAAQKEIELSGKLKEVDQYRMDIEMKTKVGIAQAQAEAIKNWKLPSVMISGQNGGSADGATTNGSQLEGAVSQFLQLKNVATAMAIAESTETPAETPTK